MKWTRRDFNRLTASAFGGMVAGTLIGCGGGDDPAGDSTPNDDDVTVGDDAAGDSTSGDGSAGGGGELIGGELPEKNACLGLNQCKEYGRNPGEHDCAGQGACATVTSAGPEKNECKFLGACNGKAAANDCKGQGGCQVPIAPFGEDIWKEARAAFEKRMQAKGTEVGSAPLPDGSNGE